eukprot:gene7398-5210_t
MFLYSLVSVFFFFRSLFLNFFFSASEKRLLLDFLSCDYLFLFRVEFKRRFRFSLYLVLFLTVQPPTVNTELSFRGSRCFILNTYTSLLLFIFIFFGFISTRVTHFSPERDAYPCPLYELISTRFCTPILALHSISIYYFWYFVRVLLLLSVVILLSLRPMLGLFHALLVSLLVLLPADIRPVSAADPLYVLNLFLWKSPNNFPTQQILEGFKAALFNTGTGADGRTIELIEPDLSSGSIAEAIEKAMTAHPSIMAIAGPVSDELLAETLAYTKEHYPTLTAVGPFTNYLESRVWSPQAYFLRADPTAEFLAVATDIIHRLRVKRVGLFRLTGTKFSQKGYDVIRSALIVMHRITLVEYVEPEESPFNQSAFDKFASDDPQAILMYSSVVQHTYEFVSACRHSVALMLTPIFFTSGGYIALYDSIIAPDVPLNFFFSSTNLLPVDTMYEVIRVFNSQMSDYIASGKSSFTSMDQVKMPITGSLTVAGWITGKVLRSGMLVAEAVVDRKAYQVSLFDQRQYAVEHSDILGVFGGVCGAYEIMQQAICKCNQGGHTVNIYKIFIPSTNTAPIDPATTPAALPLGNDPLYAAARQSSFTFPRRICYAADYAVPVYVQAVILSVSNDAPLADAVLSVQASLSGAIEAYSSEPGADIGATVAPCTSQASLLSYAKNYLVDVVIGPLIDPRDTAALLPSTLIVNPLALYPTPRIALRNTLYLMPTVDQQVYLVARVAKHQRADLVILRRLQPPRPAITAVLHNAEQIYGIAITSLDAASVTRISSSAEKLIVLAIGIDSAFVASLPRWMEQHPHAYFSVLLEEFSLYYSAFTQVFASEPIEVQRRILTFTNLPMWNDYSEETAASFPDLAKYHETVEKELVNPLSLQTWYTTRVLRQISSCLQGNATLTLLDCVYHFTTFTANGVEYQGFSWGQDCTSDADKADCQNYGATRISAISMERVLNTSVPATWGPFDIVVALPPLPPMNLNTIIAVAVPLGVMLLVLLWIVAYFCYWKSARDNHTAPKNPLKPVTIMFTDIQSSTALWAEFPEEMAEAMESHHEIIRNEIRKFECYEVKTIGDSFMIASHSAIKMVQLAIAIQWALFRFDWMTEKYDQFYLQDELDAQMNDARSSSPNESHKRRCSRSISTGAELCAAELCASQWNPLNGESSRPSIAAFFPGDYHKKWNGLRVRIGIHTGMCDIRFDEVTKGFDYYGDTVNIAARTEATAMGGQILITKNTWDSICESDSNVLQSITVGDVGAYNLRGVTLPVDMYEVNSLAEREFVRAPAEEADSDTEIDDFVSDSCTGTLDTRTKNPISDLVYKVASGLLSPFHGKKKTARLKDIMKQWHVSSELHLPDASEETIFRQLLLRFVNRRGKVIAQREYLRELDQYLRGGGTLMGTNSIESRGVHFPSTRRFSNQSATVFSSPNTTSGGVGPGQAGRLVSLHSSPVCSPAPSVLLHPSLRGGSHRRGLSRHASVRSVPSSRKGEQPPLTGPSVKPVMGDGNTSPLRKAPSPNVFSPAQSSTSYSFSPIGSPNGHATPFSALERRETGAKEKFLNVSSRVATAMGLKDSNPMDLSKTGRSSLNASGATLPHHPGTSQASSQHGLATPGEAAGSALPKIGIPQCCPEAANFSGTPTTTTAAPSRGTVEPSSEGTEQPPVPCPPSPPILGLSLTTSTCAPASTTPHGLRHVISNLLSVVHECHTTMASELQPQPLTASAGMSFSGVRLASASLSRETAAGVSVANRLAAAQGSEEEDAANAVAPTCSFLSSPCPHPSGFGIIIVILCSYFQFFYFICLLFGFTLYYTLSLFFSIKTLFEQNFFFFRFFSRFFFFLLFTLLRFSPSLSSSFFIIFCARRKDASKRHAAQDQRITPRSEISSFYYYYYFYFYLMCYSRGNQQRSTNSFNSNKTNTTMRIVVLKYTSFDTDRPVGTAERNGVAPSLLVLSIIIIILFLQLKIELKLNFYLKRCSPTVDTEEKGAQTGQGTCIAASPSYTSLFLYLRRVELTHTSGALLFYLFLPAFSYL